MRAGNIKSFFGVKCEMPKQEEGDSCAVDEGPSSEAMDSATKEQQPAQTPTKKRPFETFTSAGDAFAQFEAEKRRKGQHPQPASRKKGTLHDFFDKK